MEEVSGYVLLLKCSIEIHVFIANSVDPDQTPRSASSDLGLHCLRMSLYGTLDINGLNDRHNPLSRFNVNNM